MGLLDFINDKGDPKPMEPAAKPAAGATDFFSSAEPEAVGNMYVVVSGDSLSKIARHHYGDAARWPQIYDANKALIGDNPDHIEVGQVLTIPSI